MPDKIISLDEYLHSKGAGGVERAKFARPDGTVIKMPKLEAKRQKYDASTGTRSFVMSAEVEDRDRDIVVQSGLDLTEFVKNPVALWAHNSREPIGKWANIKAVLTGRPKRTEGDCILTMADPLAQRVSAHWEADSLSAVSIGFLPKEIERRDIPDDFKGDYYYPGYMIHAAELYECSVCSIPANPAALAKAAEGGDTLARELIEHVLDTYTREKGLLIPRRDYEEAHRMSTGSKTIVVVDGKRFEAADNEDGTKTLKPAAPDVVDHLESSLKEPTVLARVLKALGLDAKGQGAEPPDEGEGAGETSKDKAAPAKPEQQAAASMKADVPALQRKLKLLDLAAREHALEDEAA